jgi:hypothetical protein
LRTGQRERPWDQARVGNAVIALAGDIELLLDRVEVVHEAWANPDSRRIGDGDLHCTTFWVPRLERFCPGAALPFQRNGQ